MTSELRSRKTGAVGAPHENENGNVSQDRVDRGRPRSGLEIPRKVLHSSIAFVVTGIWLSHPDMPLIIRGASLFLGFVATWDFLRFRYAAIEVKYEALLGYFMRESERDRVNGVIYYLVGVLVCCTFYPRDIACLSIIILSICDTSASVFGRLFGKWTGALPFSGSLFGAKKSVAGTISAVITGALASYIFWSRYATRGDEGDLSWLPAKLLSEWKDPVSVQPTFLPRLPSPQSTLGLVPLALLNGAVAGVAEAFDILGLDDNLTLPIIFGFGAWLTMWILG